MQKFNIKNEGKNIEIKIYGEIGADGWFAEKADTDNGEVSTLKDLEAVLKENRDASVINIYINSEGGSVFDGIAIYNMLKRHRAYKRVFIEGFACSIASVIAMAGNSITMPKSSMMMIHNAWTIAMGNATELRKVADDLDQINVAIRQAYMNKVRISEEDLIDYMDKESFLTAEECYDIGLCTKIDDTIDESEKVEETLERYSMLYENKLQTLNAIKEAIKDIEQDETEIEPAEDETVEAEKVKEAEDTKEAEEVIEEESEVQEEVKNIKENALKRFFNLKEETNE